MSNHRVLFSLSCQEEKIIVRSFKERWFTFPWRPFQKTRIEKVPGIYREKDVIKVHPDNVSIIYDIMHRVEDAPTLKVKAVK